MELEILIFWIFKPAMRISTIFCLFYLSIPQAALSQVCIEVEKGTASRSCWDENNTNEDGSTWLFPSIQTSDKILQKFDNIGLTDEDAVYGAVTNLRMHIYNSGEDVAALKLQDDASAVFDAADCNIYDVRDGNEPAISGVLFPPEQLRENKTCEGLKQYIAMQLMSVSDPNIAHANIKTSTLASYAVNRPEILELGTMAATIGHIKQGQVTAGYSWVSSQLKQDYAAAAVEKLPISGNSYGFNYKDTVSIIYFNKVTLKPAGMVARVNDANWPRREGVTTESVPNFVAVWERDNKIEPTEGPKHYLSTIYGEIPKYAYIELNSSGKAAAFNFKGGSETHIAEEIAQLLSQRFRFIIKYKASEASLRDMWEH